MNGEALRVQNFGRTEALHFEIRESESKHFKIQIASLIENFESVICLAIR